MGRVVHSLFENGYTTNGGATGNQEFIDDEVALSYTGVWNAKAALESVGDDLLILPPPGLGITAFADKQVVIPATDAAAQASELFGDDGALRPFVEFSREFAVLRPETPAYAVISTTFETAGKDIMNGADVQETLDQAVAEIDANIESNDGYGFE